LRIAGREAILEVVRRYENLRYLFLGAVGKPTTLEKIACLKLKSLVIAGGNLMHIRPIKLMTTLRTLDLRLLKQLETLEGIEALPDLEELKIWGCPKIKDIELVTRLRKLRRLEIECCQDIGLNRIQPQLEKMKLEKLFVTRTT
jgi:hypothetical protein